MYILYIHIYSLPHPQTSGVSLLNQLALWIADPNRFHVPLRARRIGIDIDGSEADVEEALIVAPRVY